ncbi:hypothetical protein LZC95_52125 [Pendulispora brunnea]|uniref:VWA domain-containing protein n=1 Tax=Pendulispora brunnea TaxID=2905690 RepID=A0ABZ2KBM4_9BACT
MMTLRERQVTREDWLMFVNACFACTGQREFYSDAHGQSVSIDFLHRYILGNYRQLYARALACGINDFNQALIIVNLLATGKAAPKDHRAEEGALITRALERMPPHRAMHVVERLAKQRVNNRRTRAIVGRFLGRPKDRDLRAVKYRRCFRRAALHAHLRLDGELASFFLRGWKSRVFTTPLFESFRRAHFGKDAVYDLPYSIAEGFAAKHGIARDVFLRRIEPKLTHHERLRLQNRSAASLDEAYALDPTKLSPTKLASYILSRPHGTGRDALWSSTLRAVRKTNARFGRVACVLDRSYSSYGSTEKRRRPLAVALAVSYFLRAASAEYRAFWTVPTSDELRVDARGQTDLATPILDALETNPDLLVIVSDGFDNDPPGAVGQLLQVVRTRLRRGAPFIVHVNPVFDAESYAPKSFCPAVPTMGIRDAEDLPTLVLFARFASDDATLESVIEHLDRRVRHFLRVTS